VVYGSLDYALKSDGLLKHIFVAFLYTFEVVIEKLFEVFGQVFKVTTASLNDLDAGAIVKNGIQNVFHTNVFVAPFFGLSHCQS
jgi:hypothetical protein